MKRALLQSNTLTDNISQCANSVVCMKKTLPILISILTIMSSCSSSFHIEGTSDVSSLDGQQLFLKVINNQTVRNVDSCNVVHGKFTFDGVMDSVSMASICTETSNLMPVVIESGEIKVQISSRGVSSASGTTMNDELYRFLNTYDKLQMQSLELIRKHDQAIMAGSDMSIVNKQINDEYILINQRVDSLITTFISNNFDNVLGPGVFMILTSAYEYPVFTPWIDDLVSKAPTYFKNDPYVKAYLHDAQRIQNIQNGLEELPQSPNNQAAMQQAPIQQPVEAQP